MTKPYALVIAALTSAALSIAAPAQQVEVVNNQPFPIHTPLRVRGVKLADGATAAQQVGDDAVVIVEAAASSSGPVRLDASWTSSRATTCRGT